VASRGDASVRRAQRQLVGRPSRRRA
jgi:hypothetical protein